MSEPEIHITCKQCGCEFTERPKDDTCPKCGGKSFHAQITIREEIELRETTILKADRPGWQGHVRKIKSRDKQSLHGKEARETIDIDRSNLKRTTKYHKVEEFDGEKWETVHEHQEEFKAKRRPDK